jgi:hypothetical protein
MFWSPLMMTLLSVLPFLAATASPGSDICQQGMNYAAASDLNGGATMFRDPGPEQCRALCEDHELCGAFVYRSRVHDGCLPVNTNNASAHKFTNMPPLFPGAECFLKVLKASGTKLSVDDCACAGLPRPVCPAASTARKCAEACPTAQLSSSHGVTCERRRGFSLPNASSSLSALDCEARCTRSIHCVAWSWTSCGGAGAAGTCSLKNLLGVPERDDAVGNFRLPAGETFSCTGARRWPAVAAGDDTLATLGRNHTPWGYIQNPYHRRRHFSGIFRMHDRLNGAAVYAESSPPHDPLAPAASAALFVGVPDGHSGLLLTAEDFDRSGTPRISPVHTKNRIAVSHALSGSAGGTRGANDSVTTSYFQSSENVFVARVRLQHEGAERGVLVHAVMQLELGGNKNGTFTATGPDVGNSHRVTVHGGPEPGYWGVQYIPSDATAGPVSVRCYTSLSSLRQVLRLLLCMLGIHFWRPFDCDLPNVTSGLVRNIESQRLRQGLSSPITSTGGYACGSLPEGQPAELAQLYVAASFVAEGSGFTVLFARSTPSACSGGVRGGCEPTAQVLGQTAALMMRRARCLPATAPQ